jgi:G3E family GTPase
MTDLSRAIPVPVTILTGFLSAGKTTLLNRILSENHGLRIAVIENEFGEAGIDNDLLFNEREQIVEMNNGCICCKVRGDLVRILGNLSAQREDGRIHFDRVVIETTGLADPAPVAQTFFVEPDIGEYYRLDAIITVVDAKHAPQQLDEHHEAQEQVGFADRLLLSKTDLVSATERQQLEARLRTINVRAPIAAAHFGEADISEILDIHGFSLNAILEIEPEFLQDVSHEHDDDIRSFVFSTEKAFDAARIMAFMDVMMREFGVDLLRYKGILNIEGCDRKIIYQGVHMLLREDFGSTWLANQPRQSKIVFIGRNLPEAEIKEALDSCLVR